MGITDKAKDMMGDNMDRDAMMAQYNELSQQEQSGQIDDQGRERLSMLRSKLNM